jgi:3-(3-hydroxy-phenyl)propionate hydroxylase
VLALAREHPFARTLVNSGRLSVPTHHAASPLSTPDAAAFGAATAPGSPVPDAPLQHDGQTEWLLRHLGGRFVLLVVEPVASDLAALPGVETLPLSLEPRPGVLCDAQGLVQARLGLKPGGAALIRPDQLLAARWQQPTPALVQAALRRALGHEGAPC